MIPESEINILRVPFSDGLTLKEAPAEQVSKECVEEDLEDSTLEMLFLISMEKK